MPLKENGMTTANLPSAKSPLGRHRKVDVLVNPPDKKVEKVERVEIQKWLKNPSL